MPRTSVAVSLKARPAAADSGRKIAIYGVCAPLVQAQTVSHPARQILCVMHGNHNGQLLAHQRLEHALHGGALPRIEARQGFVALPDLASRLERG